MLACPRVYELPSGGVVGAIEYEVERAFLERWRSVGTGSKESGGEGEDEGMDRYVGVDAVLSSLAGGNGRARRTHAERESAAERALEVPTRDSECKTWRWRFDSSTVSWSMIVMCPASAR